MSKYKINDIKSALSFADRVALIFRFRGYLFSTPSCGISSSTVVCFEPMTKFAKIRPLKVFF